MTWSGYDLCYGPNATPPNDGQVQGYVTTPLIGLALCAAAFVLGRFIRALPVWGAVAIVEFFMGLLHLMSWTGGI